MAHEAFQRDDDSQGPSNRSFGLVFAVVFGIIGFFPLIRGESPRIWSIAIAIVFTIAAMLFPATLTRLNKLWMRFGLLLHKVVSPVVLGFLFFIVITPMAVAMRMVGKDSLRLRQNLDRTTYWIERTPPGPPQESFVDQF